ncbi:hypothetical protein DEO72_LG2g2218 [Vigna unguiculata]|uniref:Uncharacterized protein n=1 Tax=Vigna unguiculata TaxID=3917 RepID=A0A4D6KVV9_VIGUN|nr:hypothetical protein DEO72_LG2g2218 [Vigna unguiculata]
MNKMIEDGEDDLKCFPEDLDVMLGCTLAFKVRVQPKNRSSSVMKASNNLETIAFIRSKLESKMIKDSSAEDTCDSNTEENSKGRDQIQEGKQSFDLPICDSNNEHESIPIITYESQTDMNKEFSPTDICGSKMQSMAVGLIKSGSRGKNIKESNPTAICGSSTQSKATNPIKTGSHGNKIKVCDPIDLSPCSTQSKTLASIKTPSHTGKIKESRGKPSVNKNTEADNCMVR